MQKWEFCTLHYDRFTLDEETRECCTLRATTDTETGRPWKIINEIVVDSSDSKSIQDGVRSKGLTHDEAKDVMYKCFGEGFKTFMEGILEPGPVWKNFEKSVAKMGLEGWELINIAGLQDEKSRLLRSITIYFKRPIKD